MTTPSNPKPGEGQAIKPSDLMFFTESLNGKPGDLDAWLEVSDESKVRETIKAYAHARLLASNAEMREALEKIARWFGEFPATGQKWPDGSELSYAAAFGSNGERDFMREIARAALARHPEKEDAP